MPMISTMVLAGRAAGPINMNGQALSLGGGTLNLNDGSGSGGGTFNTDDASFVFSSSAVLNLNGGEINMSGGQISLNNGSGSGGGSIYLDGGSFNLGDTGEIDAESSSNIFMNAGTIDLQGGTFDLGGGNFYGYSDYGEGGGMIVLDGAGLYGLNSQGLLNFQATTLSNISQITGTGTPAIAAGAAAGTSPTVTLATGSDDLSGQVSIHVGSSGATTGTLATVSFNQPKAKAPFVTLTPANANAFAAQASSATAVSIGPPSTPSRTARSSTRNSSTTWVDDPRVPTYACTRLGAIVWSCSMRLKSGHAAGNTVWRTITGICLILKRPGEFFALAALGESIRFLGE